MYAPAPGPEFSPMSVAIASAFQPIVALGNRQVMGYEALTRPSPGSVFRSPQDMFVVADQRRETAEFDWKCRLTALHAALAAAYPTDLALFVNAEPSALDAAPPPGSQTLLAGARQLSIVIEITERNMTRDPAGLLRAVEHARDRGWRIAVDDVGSDSSSLALLALLRPDVIKLDMRMVQQRTDDRTAAILSAVSVESERTGAVVLAEGIETEEHERHARDMGAVWGQGWLYGKPASLPKFAHRDAPAERQAPRPAVTVRAPAAVTPFGLTHALGSPRRGDPDLVATMENDLLRRAAWMGSTAVVLVTEPIGTESNDERRRLMGQLGCRSALTAVFRPAPARTTNGSAAGGDDNAIWIAPDEPLALERSVIVVDPGFTGAFISMERSDSSGARVFDYRLSFDRELVLDAATVLLRRIPAMPAGPSSASTPAV